MGVGEQHEDGAAIGDDWRADGAAAATDSAASDDDAVVGRGDGRVQSTDEGAGARDQRPPNARPHRPYPTRRHGLGRVAYPIHDDGQSSP